MIMKDTNKNGTVYKNFDIKDIPYNQSARIELINSGYEAEGKFGKYISYDILEYDNGQTAAGRMFVNANAKSSKFGVSLMDDLKKMPLNKQLIITKMEGKTKAGKEFKYWVVSPANFAQQVKAEQIVDEIKVEIPLHAGTQLNDIEKKLVDAIKAKNTKYSFEQLTDTFLKYNVEINRAKEIFKNYLE